MQYFGVASIRALLIAALSLTAVFAHAELKVGDVAPDFSLRASDGQTYNLADYRGKQAVVLAWFPRAFTSGCTVECKSLAENGDEIRKFDVSYFMASTDPVEKNAEFADDTGADFPLLSDPDGEVATAYGVFTMGFAKRHTYYIDVDGVISHIDTAVRPSTSAQDMIANLEKLGVAQRDS
ncbi:antioxidant, AhpC/Tsa family [gamma proteobacterium NOR5-3]|nr:antioxidant, AhpC/Tsa family [gamma proteobacterium NOR5-3]